MDDKIFQQSKKTWEENLGLFPGMKLAYPAESLVRLFSGQYVPVPSPPAKVMDHGFGHGNNLLLALTKDYECAGCEISESLIEEAKKLFQKLGKDVDLRRVKGLDIPFEAESFDIVVSWDVIHYNGTRKAVGSVIEELHRVLKPGGVLFLSTVHPQNSILDRMEHVQDGSYLITKESKYDNRKGLRFFVTHSREELQQMFSVFSIVKSGELFFDLFNYERRHAAFLIYAVK